MNLCEILTVWVENSDLLEFENNLYSAIGYCCLQHISFKTCHKNCWPFEKVLCLKDILTKFSHFLNIELGKITKHVLFIAVMTRAKKGRMLKLRSKHVYLINKIRNKWCGCLWLYWFLSVSFIIKVNVKSLTNKFGSI